MSFIDSVKICFYKFFNTNGRAKRSEYWYFFLFIWIVNITTAVLEALIFWDSYLLEYGPISNTISLILLIPAVNACTRRLHDVNRSGWWQLLYFTIIGGLVILYWNIKKGNEETNRFG